MAADLPSSEIPGALPRLQFLRELRQEMLTTCTLALTLAICKSDVFALLPPHARCSPQTPTAPLFARDAELVRISEATRRRRGALPCPPGVRAGEILRRDAARLPKKVTITGFSPELQV